MSFTAPETISGAYLGSINAANRLLYPHVARPLPPDGPDTALAFEDHEQALAWLEAERANPVAAAVHGPASLTWQLADALRPFLHLSMSYLDWQQLAEVGLAAAAESPVLMSLLLRHGSDL